MPFQLVVVRGRSEVGAHRLGPGVTVAGRQDGCQLMIRSSQVSRRHCEIFEQDGQLVLKDLGSSNGTFVNGQKVEGQLVVHPGDVITIGSVKFRVERLGADGRPLAAPAPVSAPVIADAVADTDDVVFDIEEDAGEEPIPLDVEVEVDEAAPTVKASSSAPTPPPAPEPAAPEPAAEPEPEPSNAGELGEDAVADFLMNIQIDDDDRP